MTLGLLAVAGLAALGDWVAVWRRRHRLEYLLKPVTLAVLIAAAATAELPDTKVWVVAALAFGLVGDIALMFSSDHPGPPDPQFLVGLGSFLLGHVCYLVAFTRYGVHPVPLIAGAAVVATAAALTVPQVLSGARRTGGTPLLAIVAGYAGLLAAMAVLGVGTAAPATAIGALLFLASDSALAWERFVRPLSHGPLLVIVSYHLAQTLILVGLVRAF